MATQLMATAVNNDRLAVTVDELLMLVQETADYHRDESIRTLLGQAQRGLLAARKKLQLAAHRYVVGMVGLTNVGKSTLLNALLGSDLAPRRNGPCTAAPIEFTSGAAYAVTAYYRQQLRRPTWPCDGVEAVHQRLSALADDAELESARAPHKVVVAAPHPLLMSCLTIADTPGFGAAQLATAAVDHEAALRSYLQEEVSQVFWVVLAEQGIGKRELSFHDQFFADVCDDVVVTGCEDWNLHDRERYRRRFAQSFGQRMPTIHFVSGLAGLEARARNDGVGLEAAGIADLEERIRGLAEPAGRTAAIEEALRQLAEDLGYWLRELIGRSERRSTNFWRPDSWERWISVLPTDALAHDLTERLRI